MFKRVATKPVKHGVLEIWKILEFRIKSLKNLEL